MNELDPAVLAYLAEMGNLAPEDEEVSRMRARAEAMRQQSMQMPETPQGGRIAVRTPRAAYLAPLLHTAGGIIGDYRAGQKAKDVRSRRDSAFQRLLGSRTQQRMGRGFGVEDDMTGLE